VAKIRAWQPSTAAASWTLKDAVQTAVVRERMHYKAVVDPMQNMPLDLDIIDHLA